MARKLHSGCSTGLCVPAKDKRAESPEETLPKAVIRRFMNLMKLITAIVRPHKLEELRLAIAQLGVQGMTVSEVMDCLHGARNKIEIAVADSVFEPVMDAIANVARTGRGGDGRITVCELLEAVRIRTGESGEAAT